MTISDSTPSSLPILFGSENLYDRAVFRLFGRRREGVVNVPRPNQV